jgi:hypothetical protein
VRLRLVKTLLDKGDAIVHDPLIFYSWRVLLQWDLTRGRLALVEGRAALGHGR